MSDDFNPDKLFQDIDAILEKNGVGSVTSSSAPVEIEADLGKLESRPTENVSAGLLDKIAAAEKKNDEIATEDFMPTAKTDEVVSADDASNSEQTEAPEIKFDESKSEDPKVEEPPTTTHATSASTRHSYGEDEDGLAAAIRQASGSDKMREKAEKRADAAAKKAAKAAEKEKKRADKKRTDISDEERVPMFTTIDDAVEWKIGDDFDIDAEEATITGGTAEPEVKPPVSYLEGASLDGYAVENVAFGDISVGVETESVEYSEGHPFLRFLRNVLICVAAALLFSILITKFVAHHTAVDGSSMESTLSDGDQLIVEQVSYYLHDPERFDVVVFPTAQNESYIKRIIGLPGETVQIIDSQIYINGALLSESYGREPIQDPGQAEEAIYLGDDEYFVLGDNRNASIDSRFADVGLVKKDDIKGRAWLRFFPFARFSTIS